MEIRDSGKFLFCRAAHRYGCAVALVLLLCGTVSCGLLNKGDSGSQGGSGSGSGGSGGSGGSNPSSTISLSASSAPPLSLITITGSGFDSSQGLYVNFAASGGISVEIPPVQVTTTSLTVALPLILDQTGAPLTGPVSITVDQGSGSNTQASNSVAFTITSPHAAPPLAAGTVTLGFVQGEMAALQSYRQSILGTAQDTASFESAYSEQVSSNAALVTQIQSVMNGTASASFGTFDGGNINITSADLQNCDSLLLGLLQSSVTFTENSMAQGARSKLTPNTSSGIASSASSLYTLATTAGTSQSALSTGVASLIAASAISSDPNYLGIEEIWTGPELMCTVCSETLVLDPQAPTGIDVIETAPLFYSLVQGFSVNTYTQTGSNLKSYPGLLTGGISTLTLLNSSLLSIEGGLAGQVTQADSDSWLSLIDGVCSQFNCNSLGDGFVVTVDVTGSTDNVTNVQVCADFGGSNNSVCGPNGGFAVGTTNSIFINPIIANQNGELGIDPNAVEGTSYTVSVPSNQPAASFCSVTSGGSGVFGSSMATAEVSCQ